MKCEYISIDDLDRALKILSRSAKLSRETLNKFYRAFSYANPIAEQELKRMGIAGKQGARAGEELRRRYAKRSN